MFHEEFLGVSCTTFYTPSYCCSLGIATKRTVTYRIHTIPTSLFYFLESSNYWLYVVAKYHSFMLKSAALGRNKTGAYSLCICSFRKFFQKC